MKGTRTIDIQALRKRAESSAHREAYSVLDRSRNCRIGVGVRLESPDQPSFFLEVLIYLCPNLHRVNVSLLEKNVMLLKELQARGYYLVCQDDGSVSCEARVSLQDLDSECEAVRSAVKNTFRTERWALCSSGRSRL
jgi:hypothetical protein